MHDRPYGRWRWISSRWPAEQRRAAVPHYIHGILAAMADPEARFAKIEQPPLNERTGTRRWTQDEARRVVGWQVTHPESAQEKVIAVHELVGRLQRPPRRRVGRRSAVVG
ncbi:DUF6192 family protein [Actinoplanes sp. NEAU-A12]|uniref:DUF6192 family protein n=1 Tax=Actinoplanes sandaracinus TaxID=3045177 RepID=A0ABT6WG64_9ACTN|nr:DUF6192 family protein [Actinoplanes sandaracinus]MDI6098704.1 DUF6192 family protein [Actinoplanes sandaracinus]